MEPELHGSDLVAPPVPPPFALPQASQLGAAILWRWNERLALVVGGLTILLLGVIAGRVLGPATSDLTSNIQPSTVSIVAPNPGPLEAAESAAEVNPPETVAAVTVSPLAAAPEPTSEESVTPVASAPPPPPIESAPPPERAAEPEVSRPAATDSPAEPATLPATAALLSTLTPVKVASIIPPPSTQVCEPAKNLKDRKLSTALTWSESVDEAARQADEEEKLVFLIHVSGNFESPGFT